MSENQLAIIAGGGSLSDIIIETAEKKGWNLTVFAIGDLNITKNQDIRLIEMNRLDIGRIFQILKSAGNCCPLQAHFTVACLNQMRRPMN